MICINTRMVQIMGYVLWPFSCKLWDTEGYDGVLWCTNFGVKIVNKWRLIDTYPMLNRLLADDTIGCYNDIHMTFLPQFEWTRQQLDYSYISMTKWMEHYQLWLQLRTKMGGTSLCFIVKLYVGQERSSETGLIQHRPTNEQTIVGKKGNH